MSLELFIKYSKGNVLDDCECVQLVIDVDLLTSDVNQKLVALV